MTDLAGKLIDKPVKWLNERIITALHTPPQGEQTAKDFGLALVWTVNTPTPRIASKGKEPVRVKVVHASRIRNYLSPQLLGKDGGSNLQ